MVIKTKINNARIIPIEDELFEAKVFEIIGHNLEFTGLCPECSKESTQLTIKESFFMTNVS
jgi:Fe2+ or Zn2+ uptake regulation protein